MLIILKMKSVPLHFGQIKLILITTHSTQYILKFSFLQNK